MFVKGGRRYFGEQARKGLDGGRQFNALMALLPWKLPNHALNFTCMQRGEPIVILKAKVQWTLFCPPHHHRKLSESDTTDADAENEEHTCV